MTAFSQALTNHKVSAVLTDIDYYRIHGGMAVETDFIIKVESRRNEATSSSSFEGFTLSKTYSSFRTFAKQLKKIADGVMSLKSRKESQTGETTKKLARYCETVHHLIESQRHQYVGKVNYKYVKVLAKKRSQIIQEILEATLNYFPSNIEENQFSIDVSQSIETFFLTDHCIELDGVQSDEHKNYSISVSKELETEKTSIDSTPEKKSPKSAGDKKADTTSPVVPITRKKRNSMIMRKADLDELEQVGKEATLLLDDEQPQNALVPSYSHPVPSYSSSGSKLGNLIDNNPIVFVTITVASILVLKKVSSLAVTIDLDVLLLFLWAAFCVGLHIPRPMVNGIDQSYAPSPTSSVPFRKKGEGKPKSNDLHGRKLYRRMSQISAGSGKTESISGIIEDESENDEDGILNELQSPMPVFPKGAKLGSHFNCWSQPACNDFYVRGPNYLKNKVKIESADFLWPVRGIDLFLTDTCPENVGRVGAIMGGRLREVPTFIINFRLPWGVLCAYFEIPKLYLPFIQAGHDPDFDKASLPSMASMTAGERCAARFCEGSSERKDNILKIVPVVVDGPWVVKSVVGNKPAILGTKMPVNYIYQKKEDGKEMYLEADLDIVSSSAARGILSMVRSYTNVLTMDLGFVIQGNQNDELPEQMLCGMRLHGIDPISAPAYPVSQENLMSSMKAAEGDSDDEI